jgi:hypothetical protein
MSHAPKGLTPPPGAAGPALLASEAVQPVRRAELADRGREESGLDRPPRFMANFSHTLMGTEAHAPTHPPSRPSS